MKKTSLILITLLFGIISKSHSQNIYLYQKWFLKELTNCTDSARSKNQYDWSIEFKREKKAEIILHSSDLKSIQNFKVDLDKKQIILDYKKFTVEKNTKDTLILIEQLKNRCEKNIMVSMNQIYYDQKQRYLINNQDTVYYPVFGNYPKLEDYDGYGGFFLYEFTKSGKGVACSVKYQFIVSKNGDILEPKVWDSLNGKYEKLLLEIINRTKKKWSPMYIYGKPVSTLIVIKFDYN